MNSTVHFALGVIIASLSSWFLIQNIWTFSLLIFFAMVPDLDYFFSKYAKENNHRRLISHSLYPSIICMVISIFSTNWFIFWMSLEYLSHIIVDMLDWGVSLFFRDKLYGWAILLKKSEYTISEIKRKSILEQKYFFINQYMASKICLILEILFLILMILCTIMIVPDYWFILFGYLIFFFYHYYEYKISYKKNTKE